MSKFLRKEAARKCLIHKAVRIEAALRLEQLGAFEKSAVLEALGFDAVADAIRWDYIRDFLQEDEGCELVPVVSLFFKSPTAKERKKSPLDLMPERYIAMGFGKKTAGFASVSQDANAKLVLQRIKQRERVRNGTSEAFETFRKNVFNRASPALKANMAPLEIGSSEH